MTADHAPVRAASERMHALGQRFQAEGVPPSRGLEDGVPPVPSLEKRAPVRLGDRPGRLRPVREAAVRVHDPGVGTSSGSVAPARIVASISSTTRRASAVSVSGVFAAFFRNSMAMLFACRGYFP